MRDKQNKKRRNVWKTSSMKNAAIEKTSSWWECIGSCLGNDFIWNEKETIFCSEFKMASYDEYVEKMVLFFYRKINGRTVGVGYENKRARHSAHALAYFTLIIFYRENYMYDLLTECA